MKVKSQNTITRIATFLTIIWSVGALYILWKGARNYTYANNLPWNNFIGMMELNEWGDFLAGICGPIALIWVVVSVIMQSMELKEQREEMSKQAAAQQAQADYIRMQLDREEQDKCWRDIQDLIETFRLLIPVERPDDKNNNAFLTFKTERKEVAFKYTPPAGLDTDNLNTWLFLKRAVGGLRHPAREIEDLIRNGASIRCPKTSHSDKMLRILKAIEALEGKLPESKKIILEELEHQKWVNILEIIGSAYERTSPSPTR